MPPRLYAGDRPSDGQPRSAATGRRRCSATASFTATRSAASSATRPPERRRPRATRKPVQAAWRPSVFGDRPSRDGEKRPYTPRGDRRVLPRRDDRPPRADRGDARPAGALRATRSSATSVRTRRAASVRNASSTASGSFRAARRTATAQDRRSSRAAIQSRGRSAMRPARRSSAAQGLQQGSAQGFRRHATAVETSPAEARRSRWRRRASAFSRSREDRPSRRSSVPRAAQVRSPAMTVRKFDRPRRTIVPRGERRGDRPKFDRPRASAPRAAPTGRSIRAAKVRRFGDRPRRENEDDSKVFAKRPAFGGRGAYRERKPDFDRPPAPRGARSRRRPASASPR